MDIVFLEKKINIYRIDIFTNKPGIFECKEKYLERIVLRNKKEIRAALFNEEEKLVVYPKTKLTEQDISEIILILDKPGVK